MRRMRAAGRSLVTTSLVAAALVAIGVSQAGPAGAATLTVPGTYPTIQAAISAAAPGDTIEVAPGTYVGAINLNKAVTLRAAVYDAANPRTNATVIDGGSNPAVTIPSGVSPAPSVIGFELRSAGDDGVSAMSPVLIESNHVTSGKDLLGFETGGGGVARGNVLEGSRDDAIDVDHLKVALLIEANWIGPSHQDGIEIRLQDDTVTPTAVLTIRGNDISASGQDAIQIIDYSTLTNRRFVIERNLLHHNGAAAIGLLDNQETIEDYRAASILERIHVFHNTIVGNNHGISGGDNLVAVGNIFQGNAKALHGVDGGSIVAESILWGNTIDADTTNLDMATTIFADPGLTAIYTLPPGSPAIDAGVATFNFQGEQVLSQPPSAYAGAAPDLGWKEFSGGTAGPALSVGDSVGPEGNPPDTNGLSFVVTVTNPPTAGTVTVDFGTDDSGTALAGTDFTATTGTLTFVFPGYPATQTISVPITADTQPEPDETLRMVLSSPSGAALVDGTASGTITNDDAPPPTVSVGDVTAPEGNPPDTTTFSFPVTVLNPPSNGTVEVTFGTEADTASVGVDYVNANGTITFTLPGDPTTKPAVVSVVTDTDFEPTETFQLLLTGATGSDGVAIVDNVGQGTITNDDTPPVLAYLSLTSSGSVGGVSFADEDVLTWNGAVYGLLFDGSDVGVSGDLDAVLVEDGTHLLVSLDSDTSLPGIGAVDDSDVLRFTATTLGATTAGTWTMVFDGSDVGLSSSGEDVDAFDRLPDGRLLISTTSSVSVTGLSGSFADEDLLAFTPTALGPATTGTWAVYFDGSDVGLGEEDIDALGVLADGSLHLSTVDAFAVPGLSGADEDVFTCQPTQLGPTTACTYPTGLVLDGSTVGLASNDIDGWDPA